MKEEINAELSIELSDEVAQGTYANLTMITHSTTEFVLDFIRIMPGLPKARVKSRIILTPEHAKRLMAAMQENLDRFEELNGSIVSHEHSPFTVGFGGPTAEA